ncbi:hypothetical protein EIP91_005131 [Steccherinum ochraceum]|uniref:Sds3-like-domain-containing protein n=1 Tax=Steccherinum ochraceum TaxID=92696 RepID=A0A4R0R7L2_9APHY|nr:hypothetical protein EIP91_005131 [Steccherinum ochraceum]
MPSSTVSLEPLSSPSPSPPPPEPTTYSSNSNHSGAAAGLDSGSELSELTEDDQENDNPDDEDERPRPSRTRRKKRGGIVPAPMWEWAYKKDPNLRNKPMEEEEEEEQAGPAEAMEEEEDEGHDEDDTPSGHSPDTRPNLPLPDTTGDADDEPEDEDDLPEDEEDVVEDEDSPTATTPIAKPAQDVDPLSDDDEADPVADQEVDDAPSVRPVATAASPDLSDDENEEDDPATADAGIDDEEPQDPDPVVESEDDAEPAAPIVTNGTSAVHTPTPPPAPTTTLKVVTTTTVVGVAKVSEPEPSTTPMDIDEDAPIVEPSPIAAAVAQSSIMAGADIVAQPSPSPASSSASGSPRASPSPSRSPSAEPGSDRELDSKVTNGRASAKVKPAAHKTQTARLTRTRSRRKGKAIDTLDQDGADGRQGPEGDERDLADGEDVDVDSPDLELESDVLPPHRAEALDVLAQIELKFALLREKVYVEKMEGLAWEEALIAEDMHPEMLHLQTELDKRRNKRLDLAARRRDFEVQNVTKRRRLDEDGVWSWWKSARDDLQAEMTSEMNRRRRKLDRERRNFDRPPPTRVIPGPPLVVPATPTVYELVKADPFNAPRSSRSKKHITASQSFVYPQLTSLTPDEIGQDLNLLYQYRNINPYDHPRHAMLPGPMYAHPLGAHPGYDPYGALDGPSGLHRFAPGLPPMHQMPLHGQIPGFLGPSGMGPRIPSHIAPQPLPHNMMMDIDSGGIRRPSSVPGHPNHHFPPPPPPGAINLMRRSISPVSAFPNGKGLPPHGALPPPFSGSRPQGWTAENGPGSSSHVGVKESRRLNGNEYGGFDRDKNRDRFQDMMVQKDRSDRDREERDSHRLQHAPRHITHTHVHAHVHPPGQNAHHHNGPHSHSHHHFHIRHNHHPTSSSGGGDLPPGGLMTNGAGPPAYSPRMREAELQRPRSGAPTELIELATPSMKHGSSVPSYWKGNEDQPMSATDRDRGRAFGPHMSGPPERVVLPPMGMGAGYPPSPRHGPSTAPGSRAPSRRGSFSAMDDAGPRPSSSHSMGPLASGHPPQSASPTAHPPALVNHGFSSGQWYSTAAPQPIQCITYGWKRTIPGPPQSNPSASSTSTLSLFTLPVDQLEAHQPSGHTSANFTTASNAVTLDS